MADLILVPLGYSARENFCAELENLMYGQGVLVLPNRMLLDNVQQKYTLECIGIDTLATKIIRFNQAAMLNQINRRSQELVVQELLEDIISFKGLEYFEQLVTKKGFVKAMTSLLGQLSRSGASQEEISVALKHWHNIGDVENNSYKAIKDQEISLLYNYYRNYLKEKQWFDLEGKYRLAIAELNKSQCKVPWEIIYFSDFYNFDTLQLDFIKALTKHCIVKIGLCYEKNFLEQDKGREKIFSAAQTTYNELEKICCVTKADVIYAKRDLSDACGHIIKNLGKLCEPIATNDIQIYRFQNQEEEIRWVLTEIKQLLLNGVSPKQVLLTMRDVSKFTSLSLLADEYGIPVTLAQTSSTALQPLTEIIMLLLQAKHNNHNGAEAYFRLLTAELSHLLLANTYESADKLRQQHYFSKRTEVQKYIHNQFPEEDKILSLWDKFIESLPVQSTVIEYVKWVEELLSQIELEKYLGFLYKKGEINLELLAIVLQTKEILLKSMQLLQQDYENCGRGTMLITLQQWQELFYEAVKESTLILKQGDTEGIFITEASKVQGMNFDYVYLMGVREGDFPKVNNENWIYNDQERIELNALGIDMPTTAQAYSEDAFFFAATVAAANKKLVLTYFADDDIGASPYIEDIRRLFYDSNNLNIAEKSFLQEKVSENKTPASLRELIRQKGRDCTEEVFDNLSRGCLLAESSIAKRLDLNLGTFNGCLKEKSLQVAVKKQVGSSFSASALETYAACPFKFLGERVWQQQEFIAAEDVVQPADEGEFLHEVLKEFMQKHLQEKITQYPLAQLREELFSLMNEISKNYLELGKFANDALWSAELPRLRRLLEHWLNFEYADQQNWPGFMPCDVEWDFSSRNGRQLSLTLSNESEISIRGRIDRLDSNGKSIFVTDYKRSSAPSSKDLVDGLDLQMPIYLLAAAQLYMQNGSIAGGSYFVLKDSMRKSKFILQSMGNKDLTYKCKSEDDLNSSWEHFQNFCLGLIKNYVENIYQGNFPAAPRKNCDEFCSMRNICRIGELTSVKGDTSDE